jgi:hypothetical protein
MEVRRLDIRFGNVAGKGATSFFVGRASRNIGGLVVACATVRTQDATASAALALAEDKWRKQNKQCQEEAAAKKTRRVSFFIYLHWPILMNNMSNEDDCYLAACGLIQLRGSAVLNINSIESINYYSDGCCTGTSSKTVEAVDATESIINNSDGCCKATPHQIAGIYPGIHHMTAWPKKLE